MRKTAPETKDDDLRPEYPPEFFRDMKPNRFAGKEKIYNRTFVTPGEDRQLPKREGGGGGAGKAATHEEDP